MIGTGTATIHLSATTSDPLLSIRVNDVSPNGEGSLVSYGHLRLSHRNGHTAPEPLTPGEEYEITLPLHPNSHVFESDHRIRVALSAGYFPLMLPTNEHGLFTIRSAPNAPSTIRFLGTVHDSDVRFDDIVEVTQLTQKEGPEPLERVSLETSREHVTNTGTFRKEEWREESLPHADMIFDLAERAAVKPSDPSTAVFAADNTFVLEYDTEEIRVEVSSRVSRDSTQMTTRMYRDDQPALDETWTR